MNALTRRSALAAVLTMLSAAPLVADVPRVAQRSVHEVRLEAAGRYDNPYVSLSATATLTDADGKTKTVPLFWDGGDVWRFRVSPAAAGAWRWTVKSDDAGLNGREGAFEVVASDRKGSIQAMAASPHHFQRQDGSPFWFLGDTAWALYTDVPAKGHDRAAAFRYVDKRVAQGFNVIHSMLLSEAGHGNGGGPPFADVARQRLNPDYWREVDHRLRYVNGKGVVAGLVLGWGDKRGVEPFAWRRFADLDARKRYATYVAARYGAFDAYFIVAGEWDADGKRMPGGEPAARREFIEIGDALAAADPHDRMVGMHPLSAGGSVREFVGAAEWMSFGDYQQNYRQLHDRVLASREHGLPVVNSEYAYHVRVSDPDGKLNKPNSFSADDIRHASWDITMAGGYLVSGFGSTYFGGSRNKGPFDPDDPRNKEWEDQVQHLARFFTSTDWPRLVPADRLVESVTPRGVDRLDRFPEAKRGGALHRPPATTYWAMTDGKGCHILYVRGLDKPARLAVGTPGGTFRVRQFDPGRGQYKDLGEPTVDEKFEYTPPDRNDWVVALQRR